jgi:hypothetical protein
MLSRSFAPLAVAALAACGAGGGPALAETGHETGQRLSGPHVHLNLAVYFIHGGSAAGPVPLTLDEALLKGKVQVIETGQVNELRIENAGEEEVFIQAGDIVKGGRQDRVLMVSLLLKPRSGPVPISSFCVEAGRWSGRAGEDATRFTSAAEAMPSRKALLAMAAPPPPKASMPPGLPAQGKPAQSSLGSSTGGRQQAVWDSVAKTQEKLATSLGTGVKAPQSATSLQLSLENAKLKDARASYVAAIEQAGLKDGDVVGFVAAINGKAVSANVYPSNGLFRKVWARQLAAVVTEAIGEKARSAGTETPAPPVGAAKAFLAEAERGKAEERATTADMEQETRDGEKALYNEARAPGGRWVHKNYLAK